ncbi:unnamed protein product [Didymodactylos carnosus]|uniref:Uncharacterized protein n=1 Tax=Didymodactylos carnosus TaxID=1234261 RepID=A0A8S2IBQ4_9BILA|nr:unnamed protein product [Didymodactylos carnosus]CAF3732219.1 unnamed protein product [Didymodactylos carnosus]
MEFVASDKNGNEIPLYSTTERLMTMLGHSGRKKVVLSELCEDTMCVEFHKILEEKQYPTLEKLLARLLKTNEDFALKSVTSLWRVMKRLGFTHKRTSKADLCARAFDVKLVKIPVRHCVLNPVEPGWAGLKHYIRENNTRFRLNDIHKFILEYLSAVGPELCQSYFRHARKAEESFKVADNYVEQHIDPDLDEDTDKYRGSLARPSQKLLRKQQALLYFEKDSNKYRSSSIH